MSLRKPLRFCSFGGYRLFTRYWWNDLLRYITGMTFYNSKWQFELRTPGWCRDVYTYWHRARYGWAPRDTWSLDGHLNHVLAGSLDYLAKHSHGCPQNYFDESNPDNQCHKWESDLRRWAQAFSEDPQDVDIYDRDDNYVRHRAEEDRRRTNLHTALKELEPMWESLWD